MPTAEENIQFFNSIREQNKVKILQNMNAKTADERNLMLALKKIGVKQDEPDEENMHNHNINDDYNIDADDGDGVDDEFVLGDQEEYNDDLDNDDYGFIYS
jgi:hypothetical protein